MIRNYSGKKRVEMLFDICIDFFKYNFLFICIKTLRSIKIFFFFFFLNPVCISWGAAAVVVTAMCAQDKKENHLVGLVTSLKITRPMLLMFS